MKECHLKKKRICSSYLIINRASAYHRPDLMAGMSRSLPSLHRLLSGMGPGPVQFGAQLRMARGCVAKAAGETERMLQGEKAVGESRRGMWGRLSHEQVSGAEQPGLEQGTWGSTMGTGTGKAKLPGQQPFGFARPPACLTAPLP